MGNPSISILLHELAKMLEYSGATDYCFFRIGSSGGLGVPGGTVVISDSALNGEPENQNSYQPLRALNVVCIR